MRSIQMNAPAAGRLPETLKETANIRSVTPDSTFRFRWDHEIRSVEHVSAKPASLAATGDVAPKKHMPDANSSSTEAPALAEGLKDERNGAPQKTLSAGVQSLPEAPAIEQVPTKIKGVQVSLAPATAHAHRVKQSDTTKRTTSSDLQLTSVIGNGVLPVSAAEISAPVKVSRSNPVEHGLSETKGKGAPKIAVSEDNATPAKPGSQALAASAIMPAADADQPNVDHQRGEVRSSSTQHPSNSTILRKELNDSPKIDGASPVANSLQAGPTMLAPALPRSMEGSAGEAKVGLPVRMTNAGNLVSATTPQTILSPPARLDVGVFNGTHGWLRVRAELGGSGGINASVTAIDAAHEALRGAAPEIARYLEVEAVTVNSIEIHRFAEDRVAPSGAGADGQPGGGQDGSGRDEGPPQEAHDGDQAYGSKTTSDPSSRYESDESSIIGSSGNVVSSVQDELAVMSRVLWNGAAGGVGTWLNVCA